MHVVFRESHGLDDNDIPRDLKQDPADLIVLSFSDSDLGAFLAGYKRAEGSLPSLRLANIVGLKHPLSVDTYIEQTISGAKGILIRLIGGEAYWPYGLSSICAYAQKNNIALAIIPADGQEDSRLDELSTLPKSTLDRLRALCDTGGAIAAQAALAQLSIAAGIYTPPVIGQKTVPDFGFYDPKNGATKTYEINDNLVFVVFYRSYVTAADLDPIDKIIHMLRKRGHKAIGVFVPSLKNPKARLWVEDVIAEKSPKAIINATAFSAHAADDARSPLDAANVPVFQISLSTALRKEWLTSDRGLSPQDLAMHVVLPEVDGRILTGVASFKAIAPRDKDLQYSRFQHHGDQDQIERIIKRVESWISLNEKSNSDKNVAIILSTYPGKAYQMAHAVGCDAIASTNNILNAIQKNDYGAKLAKNLSQQLGQESIKISVEDYKSWLQELSMNKQEELNATWGTVENDALVRDSYFHFPAVKLGNAIVALQPERGSKNSREDDYHDMTHVPCHSYIAFYLWMQRNNLDALIHVGAHGTLEWLPGKSVALSGDCWPEILIGKTPVLYPFIVNDPGEAAMAKRRIGAVTLGHMPPPLANSKTPKKLLELEQILDEYSTADGLDPKRRDRLITEIRQTAELAGLTETLNLSDDISKIEAITKIDRFVCDIKESQYAEGLHIYGDGAQGEAELSGLLKSLKGQRIDAGPSGSPYRGKNDVTPTGRNLFTIDPRSLPTRSAYAQGVKLAEELIRKHLQDHGDYPKNYVINLWGSATMRTAGEEFAMALHLAGIEPKWDEKSDRVANFEIIPLTLLGRPRIGVVLRVSGLFRDVFPGLIELFETASEKLKKRFDDDFESADMNPYGVGTPRVFAPKPQSYGIAIDDLPLSGFYNEDSKNIAGEAWLRASQWTVDKTGQVQENREALEEQLRRADGFVHIQDLTETDLLMASDYASHQAGFIAARAKLGLTEIANYHIDHTKLGTPKARALNEEIARVVYARAINPNWLSSMMKHGFRGGSEIAATLDHMAQFAHLADAVAPELFDQYYDATLANADIYEFLEKHNPEALKAMNERFRELLNQGLWNTKRNSIRNQLAEPLS